MGLFTAAKVHNNVTNLCNIMYCNLLKHRLGTGTGNFWISEGLQQARPTNVEAL